MSDFAHGARQNVARLSDKDKTAILKKKGGFAPLGDVK
jgi:hypothetical protein